MKKTILILLSILLVQCAHIQTQEYIGTFESVPEKTFGFKQPISEKQKEIYEKLRMTIVITEKELILRIAGKESFRIPYLREGRCLVGKSINGDTEMYFPVYLKDKNTVFGWAQEFRRIDE